MKPIEPWTEVRQSLLAGFAPDERPGTEWTLELDGSVHNVPSGLPRDVRMIAWFTSAMFVLGSVARGFDVHPIAAAPAALLAAIPSAYSAVLLQRSEVPIRDWIARGPLDALRTVAAATLIGAGLLVVQIPWRVPGLDAFGWGWRALGWTLLGGLSLPFLWYVTRRARDVW